MTKAVVINMCYKTIIIKMCDVTVFFNILYSVHSNSFHINITQHFFVKLQIPVHHLLLNLASPSCSRDNDIPSGVCIQVTPREQ